MSTPIKLFSAVGIAKRLVFSEGMLINLLIPLKLANRISNCRFAKFWYLGYNLHNVKHKGFVSYFELCGLGKNTVMAVSI